MFLGKWKDPWRGAKEHIRDRSKYVKALCELAQQALSCTQMVEQQATGRMDKVGQESEVAIERVIGSPYISRPIPYGWQLTASLCCGFTSALTLMSPTLLFIHSLLSKLLMRLSFMRVRC